MARIPTQLTDTKIKNTKPKDKDYTLADGQGLHLLIKSSGVKIWEFVFISPSTKKRRKKSLGSYPNVTLLDARELRSNNIMLLNQQIDPVEHLKELKQKEKANDNGLFENVMNEWFKKEKDKLEDVTYNTKLNLFKKDVLPHFKNKHIKDITKLELLHILEEREKTAPETASRLFNYLSKLWGYAVLKDYCEYNYLSNINKNDVLTKKRIVKNYDKITDEEIFRELVNKIYNFNGTDTIKNALKVVLHIPLRAYNLCNLKWEHINFDKKLLTIPRSEMKVKNPNFNDFILPLTDEVINIFNDQKEYLTKYTGLKEFIFIGANNKDTIHPTSPNCALTRMGFTAEKNHTLHSFRGSFRTILEEKQQEHNIREIIMESVLDHHKGSKVEKAYTNTVKYFEEQKPLLEWWSNYIISLKDGVK